MQRRHMRAFLPEHTNVRNPWLPDPEGTEGGDGGQGGSGGKPDGDKEYKPPQTQADLDRIITERIARERSKFADYETLKARAARADELEAATATDLEKAVAAAKNEGKTEALTAANARIVSAEARALAAAAKFRDPADAVAFLDLTSVKVADDGTPDADAITAALATLAESKPYLVADDKGGKPKPDPSQGGSGSGSATPSVARGRELFENRRGAKKTSA